MYAGQAMEAATGATLFRHPHHPYTRGLLAGAPERERRQASASSRFPGRPPASSRLPTGCPFHPRCTLRRSTAADARRRRCSAWPAASGHVSACWLPPDRVGLDIAAARSAS